MRISDAAVSHHRHSYHDGVTSEPSTPPKSPAPRESATVLLLRDDPFEVLMVSRAARGAFASALVFPGGVIDPQDGEESWHRSVTDFNEVPAAERALRIGAIREVWEETGILLSPDAATHDAAPSRLGLGFRETLAAMGAHLHLNALTHFGHWITPVEEPRRFDTHFYLAAVDRDTVAEPDGVETLEAEWLSPAHAAELAQSGERLIIFPTMLNLMRLAESENVDHAISAALERPRVTVTPVMEVRADGARRVRIPAEAGYPVCEWNH